MKHLYPHILFLLLTSLSLQGQNITPLNISFGIYNYQISEMQYCQNVTALTDDIAFFNENFHQRDYKKYRSFYYNDACLASEDEFNAWITNVNRQEVTPIARYLLHTPNDTFSIIGYSISSSAKKEYFAMALQRKNNRWYLLDVHKSSQMMDINMFLAFVHPQFIEDFLKRPDEMKEKYMTTLFAAKGQLNGDLMMNYYEARYDPSSIQYTMSRDAFHDIAEYPQPAVQNIADEIVVLAKEYSIPDSKQTILKNMCAGGNPNMALAKISEWSGTFDVIEITDKFHSGLKKDVKGN